MYYITLTIPVLLFYLALTANLQPSNIVVGALVSMVVVYLLKPEARALNLGRLPDQLWALARYVVVLAKDLVQSGLVVARIVLNPSLPIKPGIIAMPSTCQSESGSALFAHALTLTPGELVVEMGESGTMYTHCLDATDSEEAILEAQKLRRELLKKILD
jgi:multicomponent Na+:H+ antiporter subunit E